MSDYRRLISYIYEYEGKEKGKNVGFVKLEARNGQCRLNLNIKKVYVGANAVGVYLMGTGGVETFLGNIFIRGGSGEFRAVVDAENVENSGSSLDTYYGLTVHDVKSSWRAYKTIWDDAMMLQDGEDLPAENDTAEYMAQDVLDVGEKPEPELSAAEVIKEIEEELGETGGEAVGNETDTKTPEPEEKTEAGVNENAGNKTAGNENQEKSPELENPDVLKYLMETEKQDQDPERLWRELRSSYPKLRAFDYEDGCEILAVRPQDIGRLPRENWVYGNNSFLLHGYYSFRYVILARLGNRNGAPRYLIGVPGHYFSNEKYMASMFGFPNFVLSKTQPENDGRFGYWYTDIRIR